MERRNPSHAESASAANPQHCITCSDEGAQARVLELLPGHMARVDVQGQVQNIDVSLVDAAPGDIVLVHADVAIAKLCAREGVNEGDARN